jgi:hypothetical protein
MSLAGGSLFGSPVGLGVVAAMPQSQSPRVRCQEHLPFGSPSFHPLRVMLAARSARDDDVARRRVRTTGRESEVLRAMCLFLSLLLFGPRIAILFWWLIEPVLWGATFDTFIIPLLGFLFLPWTTLMYVLVAPLGLEGLDWLWIALALAADVASYAGGAIGGRGRVPGYGSPS